MVAFANSSGGKIFIGINDKNEVIGVKDSNSLSSEIQVVASNCDPSVAIEIEKFENILIIDVKEGSNKPYRANKGFFIRNGANSQKMTTREIAEFMQAEGRVKFDEIIRENIDIEKVFNPKLLDNFLRLSKIDKVIDDYSILENLGVLVFKNNKPFFNNAGILFFSDEMDKYLFHARITCALFKGTEKHTVLDRKDFSLNVIKNIEDTMVFFKQHLKLRYEITTLQRKELLEIPEVALRESVINAVCHRDYFEKGANIMVEIFDDRVEIYNPGGLPKSLPIENFGKKSVSRNNILTSLFHRIDYIERMGTGISRIRTSFKEQENKEPKFEFDSFFNIIFPRRIEESSLITSLETSPENLVRDSDKILKYIQENSEITIKELASLLSLTTRTIEKNISNLKQLDIIRRKGSKKYGYWEIINKENLDEFITKASTKTRVENSVKDSDKNSDKILKYIKENSEITVEELSELLDVSIKTVETHIQKLKELKKIQYIKPSKNGYWEII